jgi:hypothetical protein
MFIRRAHIMPFLTRCDNTLLQAVLSPQTDGVGSGLVLVQTPASLWMQMNFPAAGSKTSPAVLPSQLHCRRLYNEPVSTVLPTPGAIFLASFSGAVRCWRRPPPPPLPVPRLDPQPNAQPVGVSLSFMCSRTPK